MRKIKALSIVLGIALIGSLYINYIYIKGLIKGAVSIPPFDPSTQSDIIRFMIEHDESFRDTDMNMIDDFEVPPKIVIWNDNAYWTTGDAFLMTTVNDYGQPDFAMTQPVDISSMDNDSLKEMLQIIDALQAEV